jgi:hypothetical protein
MWGASHPLRRIRCGGQGGRGVGGGETGEASAGKISSAPGDCCLLNEVQSKIALYVPRDDQVNEITDPRVQELETI